MYLGKHIYISWKYFFPAILISFSFYIKHSWKKYQKNFLGSNFLGAHTIQTLPKCVWIRHWVGICIIIMWTKFWCFKQFCALYENKSVQYQVVVTLGAEIFAEFYSLIEDLKTIKFCKNIFSEFCKFTYLFLRDRAIVS